MKTLGLETDTQARAEVYTQALAAECIPAQVEVHIQAREVECIQGPEEECTQGLVVDSTLDQAAGSTLVPAVVCTRVLAVDFTLDPEVDSTQDRVAADIRAPAQRLIVAINLRERLCWNTLPKMKCTSFCVFLSPWDSKLMLAIGYFTVPA